MIYAIHFICERLSISESRNVSHVPNTNNFASGFWELSQEEAKALIGGWMYLHSAKADPSYRGGFITGFEPTVRKEYARPNRISIIFHPRPEGVGQIWRGQDFGMARMSGLVEASLRHEHK